MVLTVGWLWPCDVVNLQYSVPKLIVLPLFLHYIRSTLLYSSLLPSGDTVVMMYIILCALTCLQVFYTIFLSSLSACVLRGMLLFFSIFMFFGTLSESKLTKISYTWWDSTKFRCPSYPRDSVQPVLIARSMKCSVTTVGLELVEWVCNSNNIGEKKSKIYYHTQIKKPIQFESLVV